MCAAQVTVYESLWGNLEVILHRWGDILVEEDSSFVWLFHAIFQPIDAWVGCGMQKKNRKIYQIFTKFRNIGTLHHFYNF